MRTLGALVPLVGDPGSPNVQPSPSPTYLHRSVQYRRSTLVNPMGSSAAHRAHRGHLATFFIALLPTLAFCGGRHM